MGDEFVKKDYENMLESMTQYLKETEAEYEEYVKTMERYVSALEQSKDMQKDFKEAFRGNKDEVLTNLEDIQDSAKNFLENNMHLGSVILRLHRSL